MALGKTAWSKFSQEILSAYIACSSRCFSRISFDSAMNCSWSYDAPRATTFTFVRPPAGRPRLPPCSPAGARPGRGAPAGAGAALRLRAAPALKSCGFN